MNAVFCIYNRHILGIDGKLPSQAIKELGEKPAVKADMSMFKYITKDAIVVMGRKTWESLNKKPLSGRKMNIIITSSPKKLAQETPLYKFKDPVNFLTKEQFDKLYANESNVWIIGGAQLLREYIPRCEQVYMNELHCRGDFNLSSLESVRTSKFDYLEIFQILNENNFIDKERPQWSTMAVNCLYSRDDVTLYCYHFYKDYLNGWKENA